jgi:hypothetical protein
MEYSVVKHVYILTWCDRPENLYGTALVFKTLRVGFPSATVHVVDNASLPAVRSHLEQLAQSCSAHFTQLTRSIGHHDFIEQTLKQQETGTAVFVDPDVCFWDDIETWDFNALIAGRLLPKFKCEYTGCLTHARLHTSLLWIPNVEALLQAIRTLQLRFFEFQPFRPIMFMLDNRWQRFDTTATLYAALTDQMYAFTESQLDSYDHLFCGTHFQSVAAKIRPDYSLLFERLHQFVQYDHRALKGAWRLQEEYFQSLVPNMRQM